MKKTPIVVYWAPMHYEDSKFLQYYSKPEKVILDLTKQRNKENIQYKNPGIFACPSFQDIFKNIYQVKSTIDTEFKLPSFLWQKKQSSKEEMAEMFPVKSQFAAFRLRPSSFDGYQNMIYDMNWIFFSEEPLIMRITPPWFPHVSPCDGAVLSSGEYDIGQWFRQVGLDYHIPNNTNIFKISKDDPLMYIEFKTDRPIILKQFKLRNSMKETQKEYIVEFRKNHGSNKPLLFRYKEMNNNGVNKKVLKQIKENIID
jgi:hypothetical protein